MIDVLIIGGGPAGSSAAISCLQRELSVVLIEGKTFPRETAGETLHPGVEPLLERLGVANEVNDAGFLRHEGICVQWNDRLEYQPYGSDSHGAWRGYQAWRAKFDEILLRGAQHAGATVRQPCVAQMPLIEKGRVCGLRTSKGDICARFVLDASGSRAWLGTKLRLIRHKWSVPLIAYYGYIDTEQQSLPRMPLLKRESTGWSWLAQVTPERYHWLSLRLDGSKPDGVPAGQMRAADVTWREFLEPAGPGYYLLGDAAAVLDPLSSHGVLKAIMSGIHCADLIAQTRKSGSEKHAAKHYVDWLRQWFRHDMSRLVEFYGNA